MSWQLNGHTYPTRCQGNLQALVAPHHNSQGLDYWQPRLQEAHTNSTATLCQGTLHPLSGLLLVVYTGPLPLGCMMLAKSLSLRTVPADFKSQVTH